MSFVSISIGYNDNFIIINIVNIKIRINICINGMDYCINFFVFYNISYFCFSCI